MNLGFIFIVLTFSIVLENVFGQLNKGMEPLRNISNSYGYFSYPNRRHRRQINLKGETCKIPINPPHTTYVILSESDTNYQPGRDYVKKFTALEIRCDKGYKLSPFASSISICINGEWKQPPTICIRACPSLMSSASTLVKCKYNGIPMPDCINPVKGTSVLVSCNEFYEEAALEKNPLRVCREGAWHPAIPECSPTCGMKTPKGQTNIVMGQNATPGDYPWHVAIYTNQKDYLCGGSIIDPNMILSAAHCFTDYNGKVQPTEKYLIAAGKYFREYEDEKDIFAQYSTILEIHVPKRYKGIKGFQAFDIAVLILKDPFELSTGVQPACIELNEGSPYLDYSLNSEGIVMGWGFTQEGNILSDILKELTLPYIPFEQCYQEITESFRKYITFDKICAGYIRNGTSVCGGDSGGGFVFKNTYNNRYYVKAIVSTSPSSTTAEVVQCDSNQYSAYTSIEKHIEFVRETFTYNRRQQPVICTQDDCRTEQTDNVVNCRLPNNPLHGKYAFYNENRTYTPGNNVSQFEKLFLTCDAGYEADPSVATQIICLREEEWAPVAGTCTGDMCTISPSGENGICKSRLDLPLDTLIFSRQPAIGDKSKQKCREYGKLGNRDALVIEHFEGVKLANAKEFPHMALVGFEVENNTIQWECGGSLISEKFVLSTAHCSYHRGLAREAKYILLGELVLDSSSDDSKPLRISIKNIIIHPEYQYSSRYHDIALFELEREAELDSYVRPACLSTNPSLTNKLAVASGWGKTSTYGEASKEMLKVTLDIFTTTECNKTYNGKRGDKKLPHGIVEETQLCAGSRNESKELCQGSSGGPLQIINTDVIGTYEIIGISSFGKGCAVIDFPSVYTRVSAYVEWIESIVWP